MATLVSFVKLFKSINIACFSPRELSLKKKVMMMMMMIMTIVLMVIMMMKM